LAKKKRPKPSKKVVPKRKPASKKQKPVPKKPIRKAEKKPAKKPAPKKPIRKKPAKGRGIRKAKPKPVFEARAARDVPEGFDINLGNVTQDEAYATIQARLEDAKANLPEGFVGRVLMHAYADGSVDGELYVIVPEGERQGDTAWALNDAMGTASVGKHYWMSTGARFTHKKGEEWYRKHGGLNQVETNYQRAVPANIPEENLILRKKMLTGMREKYGREAHSVFLRLHWNPIGRQPRRDKEGK